MSRPSAVPPDRDAVGLFAAPGKPRLDDLIRLPPGPKRQEEIEQIVAGLAASLAALHEAGQVHGGISPAAVAYDSSGHAMLATPPVGPEPDAEDAFRLAGYAAFEQYTDDPAYLCGPWTDVYGLAALAYFLATGSAPPSALARRVRDDCLPLHEWGAADYGKIFCDAVDSGLAMPAHARPRTAAAFATVMGASLPPRDTSPEMPQAHPSDLHGAISPLRRWPSFPPATLRQWAQRLVTWPGRRRKSRSVAGVSCRWHWCFRCCWREEGMPGSDRWRRPSRWPARRRLRLLLPHGNRRCPMLHFPRRRPFSPMPLREALLCLPPLNPSLATAHRRLAPTSRRESPPIRLRRRRQHRPLPCRKRRPRQRPWRCAWPCVPGERC